AAVPNPRQACRALNDLSPHGRGGQGWTPVTLAPATRWTTPPGSPSLKIRSANFGVTRTRSVRYPCTGAWRRALVRVCAAHDCTGACRWPHARERTGRTGRTTQWIRNGHIASARALPGALVPGPAESADGGGGPRRARPRHPGLWIPPNLVEIKTR